MHAIFYNSKLYKKTRKWKWLVSRILIFPLQSWTQNEDQSSCPHTFQQPCTVYPTKPYFRIIFNQILGEPDWFSDRDSDCNFLQILERKEFQKNSNWNSDWNSSWLFQILSNREKRPWNQAKIEKLVKM